MNLTFELFRYQILPIDRTIQGNLLTGISSIDELIERKNKLFSESIISIQKNQEHRKKDVVIDKNQINEELFTLRIAINKSIKRETKDFRNEKIDNWPSALVLIWNRPDKQIIAVQKRPTAFSSCESVLKLITKITSKSLKANHLRLHHSSITEKNEFWEIIRKNRKKIRLIEFEFITPNMANISGSLSEDLKNFAKTTNSAKNKLSIESDEDSGLSIEEENKTLQGMIDYSSQGGGEISIRIKGLKKKYKTGKKPKKVTIDEIEIKGNPENFAKFLIREIEK